MILEQSMKAYHFENGFYPEHPIGTIRNNLSGGTISNANINTAANSDETWTLDALGREITETPSTSGCMCTTHDLYYSQQGQLIEEKYNNDSRSNVSLCGKKLSRQISRNPI